MQGIFAKFVLSLVIFALPAPAAQQHQPITLAVTANFAGTVSPTERITLRLSRQLQSGEEQLAVLIGQNDVSGLFAIDRLNLSYRAELFPMPVGQHQITVWLAPFGGDWKELAKFSLQVAIPSAQAPVPSNVPATPEKKREFGFDKFVINPALNLGVKSQFDETHFPVTNRPARPTFADATMQGSLKTELARGTFNLQSQYDVVGSSFRNEALRFAALGNRAPEVDLSSWQMTAQHANRKFTAGHTSFGAHRHLINNFASRGLTLSAPINSHLDVSLLALNGTNIVGWDNFWGLANRRHRLFGSVLGFEFLQKRAGGLRLEAGVLDAWFQPRTNVNQANINDTERSRGWSTRLLTQTPTGRARFEGGFTRSQFVNPSDSLLNQGVRVVASRRVVRNARYAEVKLDLLKEFAFTRSKPPETTDPPQNLQPIAAPKKLNLTLNLRHERVDPLFRSLGAATQADLHQNQFEVVGSYGELNFSTARAQLSDNLAGIQTLLRTNTRRDTAAVNLPLPTLFGAQPNPLLPRLGYTYERVRAEADFLPLGEAFKDPATIPDQASTNQTLTAEWTLDKFRIAYRLNHSLQDNRQRTRERTDLQNGVHNLALGWNPLTTLEFNFDLNFEDADNRELARTNRTLRFGLVTNWQATKRQTLNLTFATLGAGDLGRITNSRNLELDLQWNYRLSHQSENRFRKTQTNFFIRYSNRFARARNLTEQVNTLTKLQTFNTGLNFIFF